MSKRQLVRIEDIGARPSVIDRLKAVYRSYTLGPLTSSSPELAKYFGGKASSAGISVDEVKALTFSAVWAAVSLISDDIASLPLMLYKKLPNGGKDRFESHPLYRLLHDTPNPEMSTMQWRRTMQAHALLWGNGYSEIERDGANRPVAFWPLTPDRVTPFRASARSPLQFKVGNGSGQGSSIINAADMLVLPNLSLDGNVGARVIEMMRESIGLSLAVEQFGSTAFGNGLSFGGVISYEGNPGDEVKKNNREELQRRHQGVERAFKMLALYGGAKFQPYTTTPHDAQMNDLRVHQVREVARWFKLPPHKLADLADATFSNVEQQNIDYYTSCLRPWLELWEQELGRKLINPMERNIQFVEHVADGLLRADAAGRGEMYSKRFNVASITPNEIRNAENADPLEGGDRAFVPLAMIPLDRVDEYIDSIIEKNKTPKAPPAPPPPQADPNAPEVKALNESLALARRVAQEAEDARDVAKAQRDAVLVELDTERQARAADVLDLTSRRDDLVRQLGEHDTQHQQGIERAEAALAELRTQVATEQSAAKAVTQERDALASDVLRLTGERDDQHRQVEGLSLDVVAAQESQQRAEQRVQDVQKDLALVTEQSAAYQQERDEAHRRATIAEGEGAILRAEHERCGPVLTDVRSRVGTLEAERQTVDAVVVELRAQVAAGIEEQGRLTTVALDAVAAKVETEFDLKHVRDEIVEARRLIDVARSQRDESDLTLRSTREAVRAVLVTTVAHLLAREADRARKAQGSPEKFTRWLESFYALHGDFCRSALRPSLRAWLTVEGLAADLEPELDRLVERHVRESERQLRAVLHEGTTDGIGQALEGVLRRWETERAEQTVERLTREAA